MADSFDSIVIGAGVIGSATALALSRKGHKVLCVDRLPTSGYGSTSGSCAIVRPYYSTVDGSAMAYESHFYWQHWESFLGAEDERGHAALRQLRLSGNENRGQRSSAERHRHHGRDRLPI